MKPTLLFAGLSLTLPALALAEVSGRTADGCTYRVINGQYLTSCPPKGGASPVKDSVVTASAAPMTSYSDVPVRSNPLAPTPSVQVQGGSAPSTVTVAIAAPSQGALIQSREEIERDRIRNRLLDKTYVSALLGSTTVKAANAGGAFGFQLGLGTNIDENLGVEMAYAYSKQDLNLGLAAREGESLTTVGANGSDSALASHLITAELQGHLTDPLKRLRPYLGLGLGWKASKLSEEATGSNYGLYGADASSAVLRQNSFGALGSAGTKLRLGQSFQLGFAFRYFFPFARQAARLEQPIPGYGVNGPVAASTRLTPADSELTGSGQYQLLGGLQYLF